MKHIRLFNQRTGKHQHGLLLSMTEKRYVATIKTDGKHKKFYRQKNYYNRDYVCGDLVAFYEDVTES